MTQLFGQADRGRVGLAAAALVVIGSAAGEGGAAKHETGETAVHAVRGKRVAQANGVVAPPRWVDAA